MYQAQLCIADSIETSSIPFNYQSPGLDVHHYTEPVFSIDAARTFIEHVYRRPLSSDMSVHLIAPQTIPVEAQQALLKVLEEPPAHALLYVLVADAGMLLPTVRSRLLELAHGAPRAARKASTAFLDLSYQERIAHIADMTTKKMTTEIDNLVADLSAYAHQVVATNPSLAASIILLENKIGLRGASKKMLLEHVALQLPVMNTK